MGEQEDPEEGAGGERQPDEQAAGPVAEAALGEGGDRDDEGWEEEAKGEGVHVASLWSGCRRDGHGLVARSSFYAAIIAADGLDRA